ncbi:MAG: hypothetical protein U0892_13425 [Pirellulales bacterium]
MMTVFLTIFAACLPSYGHDDFFPRHDLPFSTSDFCTILKATEHAGWFELHYIRRRSFHGRIFETKPNLPDPPRIELAPPDVSDVPMMSSRVGEVTHSVDLGESSGAFIWDRDGRQITTDEMKQKLDKPLRAILLRKKPEDWKQISDYAAYLDHEIIFILPELSAGGIRAIDSITKHSTEAADGAFSHGQSPTAAR